jgi:proline dehydrogenase
LNKIYYVVKKKQQTNTNVIALGLTRLGLEAMIYRTRGEHANHHATDAVLLIDVTM